MNHSVRNLAAMLWLEADEGHDAHVHDGRKVVEDGNDGENKQLVASVGTKNRQRLVQLHRLSKQQIQRVHDMHIFVLLHLLTHAMPSSHRTRRQDKTRQSCLVDVGGVN